MPDQPPPPPPPSSRSPEVTPAEPAPVPEPSGPPDWVVQQAADLHVRLSDDQWRQLSVYVHLLDEANHRMNLTAIRDPEQVWVRHILDSLTVVDFLEEVAAGTMAVDVGSGGGLPGIPLAIVRPDLKWLLIEATGKKAAFLETVCRTLGMERVRVLARRAEDVAHDRQYRGKAGIVVCRAVGVMRQLLEYTLPLLEIGGRLLAMKGPRAQAELEESGDALQLLGAGEVEVFDAWPEGSEWNTVIACVHQASLTPRAYPRHSGAAKSHPL